MASKHITLTKYEDHKKQEGCVCRHEFAFDGPTYPKCAHRPNGYNETLSGFVPGMPQLVSKRSLYEIDFTQSKHESTPIQDHSRARLPAALALFKQTGRQSNADRETGKARDEYKSSDPRNDPMAWHFVGRNYKDWHLPFAHEYHHIMPDEAFSAALEPKEAEFLMAVGYNMNHGKNIIILPIMRDVAYALMLPKHKGWHRSYSMECFTALNSFKQDLSEKNEGHGITADNAGDLKKDLESWQENQFFLLVQFGRTTAMTKRMAAELNKRSGA
ncbi:AHH domain-containing protein [Corallococcus sp. bb12-1]|uniref:AHH domain-containing protein n=1 Tax=Corallococcus sp. bb12-1 TaxID=2996784 RepID=UPI00227028A7|nr:AHH domain-containing protein [Corallococcus sp. bb12-1]MCY1043641.1 AHH domain-containing protein [Corallococcus sp. bb12-1]